ncbi:unnamed protein product [Tetraodon nigroviridis]|uniref:(spotted green pufferfish) hypothetical protein n=1 Tax=Tetraodon nigroviridis TaxID=99883 RepID=Q4SGS1_TETNG|nr:unnamed protein product [Tetraodon nigroviridis]
MSNMSTNSTVDHCNTPSQTTYQILSWVMAVEFMLALPLNLTVLYIFIFRFKFWKNKSIFLFNIVVADFLLVVCLPVKIYNYQHNKRRSPNDMLCRIMHFMLSIDRYFNVVRLGRRNFVKILKKTPQVSIVIWLLLFPLTIPTMLGTFECCNSHGRQVETKWHDVMDTLREAVFFTQIIIPFIILVYCTVHIVNRLRKKTVGDKTKLKRAVCVVVSVVVVFSICFIPCTIARAVLLSVRLRRDQAAEDIVVQVYDSLMVLSYLDCLLDPLVYCFCNSGFKDAYVSMFCPDPGRQLPGQAEPLRPLQEHQRPLSAALQHPGGVQRLRPQQPVQVPRGGRGQGRRGPLLRQQDRFPHRERDLGEDVVSRVRRSPRGPGDGGQDPERRVPAQAACSPNPDLQALHVRPRLPGGRPELHEGPAGVVLNVAVRYNHTGTQFFEIKKSRPLYGLMETAREMIRESLPIKCLEAVILGICFCAARGCCLVPGPLKPSWVCPFGLDGPGSSIGPRHQVALQSVEVKIGLYVPHDPHIIQPIQWKNLVLNAAQLGAVEMRKELEKHGRDMRKKILKSSSVQSPIKERRRGKSLSPRRQQSSPQQHFAHRRDKS